MDLNELATMVGRVEGKIDALSDTHKEHRANLAVALTKHDARHATLEKRVRSIELSRAKFLAIIATVIGGIEILSKTILK